MLFTSSNKLWLIKEILISSTIKLLLVNLTTMLLHTWTKLKAQEVSQARIAKSDVAELLLLVGAIAVTEPKHQNGDAVRTVPEHCAMLVDFVRFFIEPEQTQLTIC